LFFATASGRPEPPFFADLRMKVYYRFSYKSSGQKVYSVFKG